MNFVLMGHRIKIKKRNWDYPYHGIVKIDQNTEKSPGDLKRLADTQTSEKNLSLHRYKKKNLLKEKNKNEKNNYSDQKQHRQYKNQQNNCHEAEMRKKITVWIFQATNKVNLTRKDPAMSKKRKL